MPNNFTPPNCDNPPNPTFAFDKAAQVYVAPVYCKGTLDYSTSECADLESDYQAALMSEALNIAAGPVNIFPLLGIHNQGSTLDQVGAGFPLSSGTPAGFNALDGFAVGAAAWRSIQTGSAVLTDPAWIGYDFGTKKAWQAIGAAQERYFPHEPIRKKISTIKIKQSLNPLMRCTQVRIEACDDGVNWQRIDVIMLPNTDLLVTANIRAAGMWNKWRIMPSFFAGVSGNLSWEVLEIHLLESTELSLDTIQDFELLENRDRAYCQTSLMLKCTYDLLDVQTELAKFGINLPQTYIFTCSFADMISILGRPVIVGDIVELPGEVQYDHYLKPVRKWLEVTDCSWSTEGYTNNWKPALYRFYGQPILPSVEHRDILGLPGMVNAAQSDDSFLNGLLQDGLAGQASEAIKQHSSDLTPQTGSDAANIQSGMPIIGKGDYDGNDLYSEDAIPPNGDLYTYGNAVPPANSVPLGSWFRQTYTNVAAGIRPPDRLLRVISTGNGPRWFPVEVNTRGTPESHKKTMAKIMSSGTSINLDKLV